MNNRNPFIPNIPTAQGHWSDPQIYTHNSSNNNNNQQNGQVPFTAHQQMQSHQHLYNVGYTTTSASSLPSLPLQTNSTAMFCDAWGNPGVVNVNSAMPMNYSYQQINSCYQQQNQQIVNSPVMHQIVTQSPRVVPLALDTSHFVHFPMNLSPPAGMVPLPLNSRSPASMTQFSSRPSDSSNMVSLSLNSRSPSSSVMQFSVNPSSTSSLGVPISLDSRSTGSIEHLYANSNSSTGVPISFNSRVPDSSSSSYVSIPLSLNVNPRSSSGSTIPFSMPSSPPGSMSRSPASMSPFSATSSTPSPTLPLPSSSRLSHAVTSFSMSSPTFSYNSHSPAQMIRVPQNSPSPTPVLHGHQNSRSIAQLQQHSRSPVPGSHLNQQSLSPAPLTHMHQQSRSPAPSVHVQHQSRTQATTAQLLQHQSRLPAPMPHILHNNLTSPITSSRSQMQPTVPFSVKSPSPPPVKAKRTRATKPKKSPKKPIPVNVSTLSLTVSRTSPSPFPLTRPNIISSIANSWSSPMFPVPVSAHLSSHINPRMNGRSSIIQSSISPFPITPASASIRSSLMLPLSGNRISSTANSSSSILYPNVSITTTTSPVMPISVIRSTSVIQTSSTNPSVLIPTARSPSSVTNVHHQSTMSPLVRPIITPRVSGPTSSTTPHPIITSLKDQGSSTNNRFSVLDYALERAGISSSGSSHEEMEHTEVFQESEILQLVGEIPDQSAELQMLNPNHQLNQMKLKPETNEDGESISAWERDAFNRALGTQAGDEDLESELNRFYCPPSPPSKDSAQKTIATQSTSTATPNTVPATDAGNSTESKIHSTLTLVGSSQISPTKTLSEKEGSTPGKGNTVQLVSDDDDCEVILVKLSDKKRKVPPGAVRRGVPPKKMQAVGRGRGSSTQSRSTTDERPGKAVDPRAKAMARAAYPNGRYVSVAPKTTVPIPPPRTYTTALRQDGKKSTLQEIIQPKSVVIKSTARKSTAGVSQSYLQQLSAKKCALKTQQNTPNRKSSSIKPSALSPPPPSTRSTITRPLRSHDKYTKTETNTDSDRSASSLSQRPKRQVSEISKLTEKPQCKVTRQTTKALKASQTTSAQSTEDSQSDKKLQIIVERLSSKEISDTPPDESRPPIMLKISLKDGKRTKPLNEEKLHRSRQQKPTPTPYSRPGPKSRKAKDLKNESKPNNQPNKTYYLKRAQKADLSKNSKLKSLNASSEDDLLIVEEYLADSDESFDLEGERDEASSDSETEPESHSDSEDDLTRQLKTRSSSTIVQGDDIISKSALTKIDASSEEMESNEPGQDEQRHSEESIIPSTSDTVSMSQLLNDNDDVNVQGESTNKSGEVLGESSSDTDSESLNCKTSVQEYEMPKPKVIIKGTKEDADKAVADMRQALSLLSKIKLPFLRR